ncbi:MAG: transglycosylase domain-containing protein, partial [Pseudomonadota bacterium]
MRGLASWVRSPGRARPRAVQCADTLRTGAAPTGRRTGIAVVATIIACPIAVLLAIETIARLAPPPDLSVAARHSALVLDANGRPLRGFLAADGQWRLPADLEQIDPSYTRLLLAYEDRRFYQHNGIDLRAGVRALLDSVAAGRVVSGASTITMQTAKLLRRAAQNRSHRTDLPPGRQDHPAPKTEQTTRRTSWRNKGRDLVAARQLELRLSKRQILELYLTPAPFGGNL